MKQSYLARQWSPPFRNGSPLVQVEYISSNLQPYSKTKHNSSKELVHVCIMYICIYGWRFHSIQIDRRRLERCPTPFDLVICSSLGMVRKLQVTWASKRLCARLRGCLQSVRNLWCVCLLSIGSPIRHEVWYLEKIRRSFVSMFQVVLFEIDQGFGDHRL